MCIMNKQYTYIYWWRWDLFFFLDSEAEVNKFRDHCSWLLPVLTPPCPGDPKRRPSPETPLAANITSPACPPRAGVKKLMEMKLKTICCLHFNLWPQHLTVLAASLLRA